MARLTGPDQSERTFYYTSGSKKGQLFPEGTAVPLYADSATTLPADVTKIDGSAVPLVGGFPTVYITSTLEVDLFKFPDTEDPVVYTRVGGGPVVALHPRTDDRVDALAASAIQRANHTGTQATSTITNFAASIAGNPASAGMRAALRRSMSTCMLLVGDSTGDATGVEAGDREWFYRLGQSIGAKYPSYNVWFRPWNDTTQKYDMPEEIQAGPLGRSYVTFAGSGGMQFTSPVAANIPGDLDIIVEFRPGTNLATGTQQVLAAQIRSTGNQVSWTFGINGSGFPFFSWSPDGTGGSTVSKTSTAVFPYGQGTWSVLRVQHDVDNGSSGNDVKFFTATDKNGTYTQLGSTVTTAGVTSHFATTAPYTIGSRDSTFALPFAGDISWVEIRNSLTGGNIAPVLAVQWDQASTVSPATCTFGGSPTLLLLGGSKGGMGISYFDDSTRRPKLFTSHNPQLIILSTGHNEGAVTTQAWISAYQTWVNNIKTILPGVPIAPITQNPILSASHTTNDVQVRAHRGDTLMTWGRSQAGVYPIDTYAAFTNPATQVSSDDVHPTAAGSTVWAAYMLDVLGF